MNSLQNSSNFSGIYFDDIYGSLDLDLLTGTNQSMFNSTLTSTIKTTIATTTVRNVVAQPYDKELVEKMQWAVMYVLTPCVSIVGFMGNILSIILIVRDGLSKSSNVLLIALAVSDTLFLLGTIYVLLFNRFLSVILKYSQSVNYLIYYTFLIFQVVFLNLGLFCSYTLPMLITAERLFAIFFPLKFRLIITPIRSLLAVVLVFALYGAYVVFLTTFYTLHGPFSFRGKTYTFIRRDYTRLVSERATMDDIVNVLTGSVPIVVLVVGCVVIGYKVQAAARRRAKMTSSQGGPDKEKKTASTSRTTKTLLAVCVTFVILSGIVYIYDMVIARQDNPIIILVKFGNHVKTMVICINASSNFFIYVISNAKFKDQLIAMFTTAKKGK